MYNCYYWNFLGKLGFLWKGGRILNYWYFLSIQGFFMGEEINPSNRQVSAV
jgi:hypothetical protein